MIPHLSHAEYEGEYVISLALVYRIHRDGRVETVGDTKSLLNILSSLTDREICNGCFQFWKQFDRISLALSVGGALALGKRNRWRFLKGIDPAAASLVTISQETTLAGRRWSVHYGPVDFCIQQRGGDLTICCPVTKRVKPSSRCFTDNEKNAMVVTENPTCCQNNVIRPLLARGNVIDLELSFARANMLGWFRSPARCPVDPPTKSWIEARLVWLTEQFGWDRLLSAR